MSSNLTPDEIDRIFNECLKPDLKQITIRGGVTSNEEKIAKSIRSYTKEEALTDYEKLVNIHPKKKDLNKIPGNLFVDYYMFPYRLEVSCNRKKGINFYDFYKNPKSHLGEKTYNNFKRIVQEELDKGMNRSNAIYEFYRYWICSVSLFKPLISKYLFEMYKPHTILDPTMGWGGRLVGAMSIPNTRYIGFDTNTNLRKPYNKMIKDMKWENRCEIYFEDSSKADFSRFKYNLVFTSPPYFIKGKDKGIEGYKHEPQYTSYDDWTERFFNPVMTNAYNNMEKGGAFCINTNSTDYELLKKLFGSPFKKINIRNRIPLRTAKNREERNKPVVSSTEFIYIWIK